MMRNRVFVAFMVLLVLVIGVPAHADTWRRISTPVLWPVSQLKDFASDGQSVWIAGGQGYVCLLPGRFSCAYENPGLDVVRRYDGAKWVEYPVHGRDAGGFGGRVIGTIKASGGEVWIQGDKDVGYLARLTGSAFEKVEPPASGAGNRLLDVGPAGVWVADGEALYRRTGATWTRTPLPADAEAVYGVSARSATDAWVIGHLADRVFTAHWDGVAWTQVPVEKLVNRPLNIKVGAGGEVWAHTINELLHWDGTAWTVTRNQSLNTMREIELDASGTLWILYGGRLYRHANGVSTPVGDPLLDQFDLKFLAARGDSIWGLGTGPFDGYNVLTNG